jgi:hypothetical protein
MQQAGLDGPDPPRGGEPDVSTGAVDSEDGVSTGATADLQQVVLDSSRSSRMNWVRA